MDELKCSIHKILTNILRCLCLITASVNCTFNFNASIRFLFFVTHTLWSW